MGGRKLLAGRFPSTARKARDSRADPPRRAHRALTRPHVSLSLSATPKHLTTVSPHGRDPRARSTVVRAREGASRTVNRRSHPPLALEFCVLSDVLSHLSSQHLRSCSRPLPGRSPTRFATAPATSSSAPAARSRRIPADLVHPDLPLSISTTLQPIDNPGQARRQIGRASCRERVS